ncbi:MAG: flagellin [Alphaproteobacteria bacterium]|nr:flagellin [Alphaproteobacteria bacterium]
MASSDIVLSAALRNNLLSLQNTQRNIDTVQLRLATGLKINSALDGPQQFFTAKSLNNRASDLGRLLEGIALSIQTIQEADKGVTALTGLIEQAQAIAEEAQGEIRAASGFAQIKSTADLSEVDSITADSGGTIAVGDDITVTVTRADGTVVSAADVVNFAATDTIYNVAGYINANATINPYVRATVDSNGRLTLTSLEEGATIRVTDGTTTLGSDGYAFLGLDGYVGTEETVAGTRQGGTAIAGRTIYSKQALAAAQGADGSYQASTTLGTAGYLDNAGADSIQVILNIDGVSTTTSAALLDTNTIQDLIDDINSSAAGDDITASWDAENGRILLTANNDVGYVDIQFQANAASTPDFGFTGSDSVASTTTVATTDVALGAAGNDISERFNFSGSSADITQLQDDYNEVRNQIDSLVEDANFRGVNLLASDNLETFFNEDRTNSLVTQGVDFTALGLGLDAADFSDAASVQVSIDASRAALDSVRNFGTSIANDLSILQNRRDFTESTINVLKAGAEDLTVADQNEEGANLLALQTRQQLGVTSLALAAQSQQSVLRLF